MPLPDNPSCQHPHPDPHTGICPDCGELMIAVTYEADTITSAPNAALCQDPEHLAAIREGREFECSQPYIPDITREKTAIVGYEITFTCRRCDQEGTLITPEGVSWDCGRVHRAYRAVS